MTEAETKSSLSKGTKGNCPDVWNKLLALLDEKLQLGLLEYMRRATSYNLEDDTLYIQPGSSKDYEDLCEATMFQHLTLLAEEIKEVQQIKIEKVSE